MVIYLVSQRGAVKISHIDPEAAEFVAAEVRRLGYDTTTQAAYWGHVIKLAASKGERIAEDE